MWSAGVPPAEQAASRRRPYPASCYSPFRCPACLLVGAKSNLRHDNFIPEARVMRPHSRGRLPHWRVDNATYFITFRLCDSLPRDVAQQLFDERNHMLRGCTTTFERARLDAAFGIRLDLQLDRNYGSCVLREHGELDRVVRSPQEFNETRAYIRGNPATAGLMNWPWVG